MGSESTPSRAADKQDSLVGRECVPDRFMDEMKLLNDKYIAALNTLDLMRDEFMRIHACPGADNEIKGLCDRAISGIERRVPLTIEAENLQREAAMWRAKFIEERGRHLATLQVLTWTEQRTAALLDAVSALRDFVEGRRHDSDNIAALLNASLPNNVLSGSGERKGTHE